MNEPYRFLKNYECTRDDIKVFRGRKREAASLVSEITTRHLVILFAPTGTGKSSLINAGVRPALEALGYSTLYVQPKSDVEHAIRLALEAQQLLRSVDGTLAAQLRAAARAADQPLVVFLDQFEEFFLYATNEESARAFVSAVATLYRDRASGVHFLFSLREDFFVEMDIFRDEIPTLFQANSSLRLRAFERESAREAIVEPAGVFGVTFVHDAAVPGDEQGNRRFLDRVLDELQVTGAQRRISPIHLQIVCDTLWAQRKGAVIDEATYDELGGVKQILAQRFRRDLAGKMDDGELLLFEMLMPLLRSDERGTKKVMPISLLPEQLNATAEQTNHLVARLVELRLLHEGTHGTIEWASDYLSGQLDSLLRTVRSILLRRLLDRAMRRARDAAPIPDPTRQRPPTDEEVDALHMRVEDFRSISNGVVALARDASLDGADTASMLSLTGAEVRFLFEASLEHSEHLDLWRRQAIEHGIDVIPILQDKVLNADTRTSQAESAIRSLVSLGTPEALVVLAEALAKTAWAPLAAAELGGQTSDGALTLLRNYLELHPPTPGEASLMSRYWTTPSKHLLIGLDAVAVTRTVERPRAAAAGGDPASERSSEADGLSDADWQLLVRRIRDGRLVPIIGMGNVGRRLAEQLGDVVKYPGDSTDLATIAEYALVHGSRAWLVRFIASHLQELPRLGYADILAQLPITFYISMRFDDVLTDALQKLGKTPQFEYWRGGEPMSGGRIRQSEPTVDCPLVYQMLGRLDDEARAILTAADRFELIGTAAADSEAIPLRVRAKYNVSTPLFLDFEPGTAELQVLSAVFQSRPANSRTNAGVFAAAPPLHGRARWADLLRADAYRLGQRAFSGSIETFVSSLAERWKVYSQ